MRVLQRFVDDESGATAIEYGLIVALLAVGCITAMTTLGGSLMGMFDNIRSEAGGAMDSAGVTPIP